MTKGAVAALVLALLAGPGFADRPEWRIGPRRLPPPAHASVWLRERIAGLPTPELASAAPANLAEWKELIAARDAASARFADALAEREHVTIDEENIAGVRVYRATPQKPAAAYANRLIVNVHGGGWAFDGGRAATIEATMIAAKTGAAVMAIDYRRPPDFPYPAARDDVVAVWKELAARRPATSMALGGTSAGGNLTLAATRQIIDLGLPRPGALYVGTPVVDLARAGDSRFINEGVDAVLTWDGVIEGAAALYAGGRDYRDPGLSPVYADFSGFPPTYLISATRDLLLSDTIVVHRKLRQAGVEADLNIYEGMSHSDYLRMFGSPESDEHFRELDAFLKRRLSP